MVPTIILPNDTPGYFLHRWCWTVVQLSWTSFLFTLMYLQPNNERTNADCTASTGHLSFQQHFFSGVHAVNTEQLFTHTHSRVNNTLVTISDTPPLQNGTFFSLMCFSGVLPHHYSNHFPSQQTLSDIILCHVTLMNPLAVNCDTRFDFISMLDSQQFIKSSLNITIRETEVCVRTLACMRVCVCERECEWL